MRAARLVLLTACMMLAACGGDRELQLPDADAAARRYGRAVEGEVRGNLLELRVALDEDLRRGGSLWARSSPYFYLFSPSTQELFSEYPDLAGVRVVTRTQDGAEVARATLHRETLHEYEWRRALNVAGRARLEGTRRPGLVENLVHLGEEHAEYSYNPEFVPQ